MPRLATIVVPAVALAIEPTPAAAPTAEPPMSTPHVQQTSSEAFIDGLLSTPSTHTGAASQRNSSPGSVDRA